MDKLISSVFHSLYRENFDKNFVFSPASYLEAIHSLSLCLNGDNLQELLNSLEISENELLDYIKLFKQNLELENYNCLFSSNEYAGALNKDVIKNLNDLDTEIKFFEFSNIDFLINEINNLVSEKTNGKIINLISKNDINEFVKFIVLNCVYFKKDWFYEFEYKKHYEPFYGNKKQVQIKYLTEQNNYKYYEDSILDIVELPYKDSDICCYLLVPKNNLFEIINNIEENYNKIKLVKNYYQVSVTVPAFKTESTLDLVEPTKLAGANKIFEWNKNWKLVDFSKLLPETVLKVGLIKQKAYIDFTQKGTEATAATIATIMISGCIYRGDIMPKIKFIRADKPFLYVLANKNNKDVPLFMGTVNQVEDN